jgi:two-component system C4-dicarboxylate transport response regulator DctD
LEPVAGQPALSCDALSGGLSQQVDGFERSLIASELARPHNSLRSLAEALGVPRKTLHDKLRKHGLSLSAEQLKNLD